MNTVYIYTLNYPEGNVRYVGKTVNIKRRLSNHIQEAKRHRGKRYVLNWIYSLVSQGKKPTIHVIEECTEDAWQEREIYWIEHYRRLIPNLCNLCDGGLGGMGADVELSNEERLRRADVMRQNTKNKSKFNEEEKLSIWSLIQENKTLDDIQNIYPEYSRQMDFGVKNGRQWKHITGLTSTPIMSKRKGYTFNQGRYLVRTSINGKRKTLFSSKSEEDVLKYINKIVLPVKVKQ